MGLPLPLGEGWGEGMTGWSRIWTVVGAVGVRTKIMGIALGLVLLLGLGLTFQVRMTLLYTLRDQLVKRGISIAHDMAARSTDLILTNNLFALHEFLRDTLENNADLRYVFILDADGQVLVHSFSEGFPIDLLAVNPVQGDERYALKTLDTEEGLIRDVAVPIFNGRAGVARVGMSEQRLDATVQRTTNQLLLATILVAVLGVAAAYGLTWILTRPILELVDAARAVTRGDLSHRSRVWARDEIGQLGVAFNAMTAELERAQQEREERAQLQAQLLQRIISAQEEERKRIARELHDETSQALSSLVVGLKVIEGACTLEEVQGHLAELKALTSRTLDEVHDLALELRPSVLDDLGLVAALQRYARDCSRKFRLPVDFHAVGLQEERLPPEVETALYRIVQEALTNSAKYARAHYVSVLLEQRDGRLRAIIEDDGVGFDAEELLRSGIKEKKLGLFGMQERASLIGGRLAIESAPGAGTTVMVEVPVGRNGH